MEAQTSIVHTASAERKVTGMWIDGVGDVLVIPIPYEAITEEKAVVTE